MFYFDPLYFIIVGPAILLTIWAQIKVKGTVSKYAKIGTTRGLTGAETAQAILRHEGIENVRVEEVSGWLSDHYDPRSKTLRLSPDVYRNTSVSSVGIAAHEVGHAIQDARSYAPLVLRSAIAPAAMFGSNAAMFLLMIGFMIGALGMVKLGIILFATTVAFQLITLPVEINASSRARAILTESGIVTQNEAVGVGRVLNAAALTYVAAAIASLTQLLYFLLRSGLLGSRED
jgi:Zn-dependent membrane protease YugP